MTATVPRADIHRLPVGNFSVCLVRAARKGKLMLAEGNGSFVFIFLRPVRKLQ